ncbi:hypothetical protein, partial [Cloacibacillus porcorum]|uniref:hypothetical protein n=1 Tax=Cloacibacillus porcorum TaxID=1197717 RepID=UPI003F114D23
LGSFYSVVRFSGLCSREGAKIFGKSAFIRAADFVTTSGITPPNNAGRGVRDSCSPRNPAGRTFVYIIIAGFFI